NTSTSSRSRCSTSADSASGRCCISRTRPWRSDRPRLASDSAGQVMREPRAVAPGRHAREIRPWQSQLLGDELDVVLLAGAKQPAWPDVELLGGGLEHGGRILRGVDADRVEEDVAAHAGAEKLLHLDQPRRLERALILAAGVDEVDRDFLALEQIVIEMNRRAVLRGQQDVRKVIGPPGSTRLLPGQQTPSRRRRRATPRPSRWTPDPSLASLHKLGVPTVAVPPVSAP